MNRQDLFNQVAEAIKSGDYKCIHYGERDGRNNIIITLNKDLMCFANEDGTSSILAKGNNDMLGISRQELIDLSIEGAAAAEERRRQESEKARLQEIADMKEKLPRWKEQQAVLQAKIAEAERLTAEAATAIVQEHIARPVEYPTTSEEAASINAEFAERARKMVLEGGGTPIPLPSPDDLNYPDEYDKVKERAKASLSKEERAASTNDQPWYKRFFK